MFKRFNSFTDGEFVQYLNKSGTYFVMCHDGAMPDATVLNSRLRSDSGHDLQEYEEDQKLLRETKTSAPPSSAGHLRKVNFRVMILWFTSNGYNVALINELQCTDSKVSLPVLLRVMSRSNDVLGDDCNFRVLTTTGPEGF
jgi:hypothetical protein